MPDEPMPDDIARELRADLAAGNKIAAIKRYRELTGLGLAEAKAAVETMERGAILATPSAVSGGLDPAGADGLLDRDILASLFAGNKIAAIKVHRRQTGKGLREAKEFIDALEARLRLESPERFTAAPAKGCGATAIALAAIIVGAIMVGGRFVM